ncbi:hypothetical protein KU43P_25530 [Pseudomonas sp. KU43P]|nr:hypothetical protein KU43P_25530 [Pseudomonas sp. KU43P]
MSVVSEQLPGSHLIDRHPVVVLPQLAFGGAGIARLAYFHVGADINAGRRVPLLEDFESGEEDILHAVFIGPGRQLL